MIATDEDALVCDLAETYHVLDYRMLPLKTAAALASGLRSDARIFEAIRQKDREAKRETETFESKDDFERMRRRMMGGG